MIKSEASTSARSAALADLWRCLEDPGPAAEAGRVRLGPASVKNAPRSEPVRLSGPLAYSLLKRGISSRAIGPLSDFLGVGKGAVADMLEIDRGTAARWASKDQPLPTHAAEGVLRMIELDQLAIDTFETEDEALQWLRKPHPMLDGDDPLTAARTSFGAQRVKDILVAIRYGGVA